ncbi:MAG: helicase C-terminal domain-containing protein [Candidatus Eisenbacteria bacterium]
MSLEARVRAALQPGGALARFWPLYEERHAQVELARDVARAVERGGILMAEAPTGVGKSVAYLLPAVLHAAETDQRVVVATATKSLQDQLFERDLPAVLEALGVSVPIARLKGKANYLCTRLLDLAEAHGDEETEALDALRQWAAGDAQGDLDRFDAPDAEAWRRVRPRVAADPQNCSGALCRRGRECFWARARRAAGEARITIVNHALLARAAEIEGLLPEYDVLVVDEAHRLEGVLLSQLERTVSRHRLDDLLRQTGQLKGARRGSGLLARIRSTALPLLLADSTRERIVADLDRLSKRADEARDDIEALFRQVAGGAGEAPSRDDGRGPRAASPYGSRRRFRSQQELLGRELQPLQVVLEHCDVFADAMRRASGAVLAAEAGTPGEELAAELDLVAARWTQVRDDLLTLTEAVDPDWVYWKSQAPNAKVAELRGSPVMIGAFARQYLLARARTAVLTSATLSSAGDFAWAAERLGLAQDGVTTCEVASYASPFPLHEQMRAYVYDGGADEAAAVADVVAELAKAAERNALVLFTSHERLRRARTRLAASLPAGRLLLAQDVDGPAGILVERFRAARGAVLLGVQSLWEGVDFPGETLEMLVVAKLPFSVPDDPIVEARGERLRERGQDPFRADAVPEAVVRFRQGVGRLIRRSDDRGVLVVCDTRLASASYRRPFRASLPVEPELWRDARALADDAARFLTERDEAAREDV